MVEDDGTKPVGCNNSTSRAFADAQSSGFG